MMNLLKQSSGIFDILLVQIVYIKLHRQNFMYQSFLLIFSLHSPAVKPDPSALIKKIL